jgi:hypothetical protein
MLGKGASLSAAALVLSLLIGVDAALWGRSSAELEERLSMLCAKLSASGPMPSTAIREACEGFVPDESSNAEVSWFVTLLFYGGTALLVFFASTFLRFVEPTHGRVIKNHVIYLICIAGILLLAPARYQVCLLSGVTS